VRGHAERVHQRSPFERLKIAPGDTLSHDAISGYLAEEARFVEAVKLGEAALEHAEYLTHEQVGERLDQLFRS